MKYRKLRIACSAVCGILSLLLMALWVRSVWVTDLVSRIDNRKIATTIGSQYGTVYVAHFDAEIGYRYSSNSSAPHPWAYKSISGYTSNNGLFAWNHRQTSLHISLPHWLIAIVATMIGAGCWLPLHFSLRTLLFFTTLVAAALGLAVYAAR